MKKTKSTIGIIALLTASLFLQGCGQKNTIDDRQIIVGASASPHAEILLQAKATIEQQGYTLNVVTFDDYVMPNVGVSDGSLDANYFQHQPYLTEYNEKNKTDLVSAGNIHFEPLTVYSKKQTLTDIKQKATFGIPSDRANGGRALKLLESLQLLTFDPEKGSAITKNDILSNPYQLSIIEFEAKLLPSQLEDLDYAVINGNYALSSKITAYALANASESASSEGAALYANLIACKKGNETKPAIRVLIDALQQPFIRAFIEETYQGAVIAF